MRPRVPDYGWALWTGESLAEGWFSCAILTPLMPARRRALVCFFLSMVFATISNTLPSHSRAEEQDDPSAGWRVGAALFGGFQFTKAKAQSNPSEIAQPFADPPEQILQIRPDLDASSTQTAGLLLGSVEIDTPALLDRGPRPRLFLRADVGAIFGQEDDPARETDPRGRISLDPAVEGLSNIDVDAVVGQGSRVSVNNERLTYSAGLGLSFEFPVAGRKVWIKPSAEYAALRIKTSVRVSRAVAISGGGSEPNGIADFRHVLIEGRRQRTFHAAGVGLELETEAGRLGPLDMTVYASVQALNILGGRQVSLTRSNAENANETARFRMQLNDWMYRAGVGIRLSWTPN